VRVFQLALREMNVRTKSHFFLGGGVGMAEMRNERESGGGGGEP
jgi:hypothetical protein